MLVHGLIVTYQTLLAVVQRLGSSMEALAALSAELQLRQSDASCDPRVRTRLRDALERIEPGLLDGVTPDQEALVLATISALVRQALDLADNPARPPGWSFTDPPVLQSVGKRSRRVVQMINELSAQMPDLNEGLHRSGAFLDVGTGAGWLAIEAARTWPSLRVVGIDPWEPSLALARQNLLESGVADRIELRAQRLEELSDHETFTLVWLPGPFLAAEILPAALASAHRALKPEGWLVFGLFEASADPLGKALTALRAVRSGGQPWDSREVEAQLHRAGFAQIRSFTPANLPSLVVARRAA